MLRSDNVSEQETAKDMDDTRYRYRGFSIIEDHGLLIGIGDVEINDRMRRIVVMARDSDHLRQDIDSILLP